MVCGSPDAASGLTPAPVPGKQAAGDDMKAMAQHTWRAGAPLELVELPDRDPEPREIRVAVEAIGVNPVDWKMRTKGPLRIAARLLGPRPPVVVGVDFAGIVAAVGERVEGLAVGQRVVGGTNFARGQRGSYADTVYVRADQVCPVPDGIDPIVAGALPVTGVTAHRSIVALGRIRHAAQDARRVLVLGASGGVGQLAVQLAKHEGAFVVGVCSARNAELVTSLGADATIDYRAEDPLVAAQAHGTFQVVVDCAGGYSGFGCRALLHGGGRHVMVAGDSLSSWVQVLVPPFRSRSILGAPDGARLRPLMDAVAAGALKVEIAQTLPLAEAERAHELSRSGRMTGKLVLVP
jgi:NADPH:quinone reductase-like Zn-dependent oxidoreductase